MSHAPTNIAFSGTCVPGNTCLIHGPFTGSVCPTCSTWAHAPSNTASAHIPSPPLKFRLGPLTLEFEPDGQDSGVGMIRLTTVSGGYAETAEVPRSEWDAILRHAKV